MTQADRHTLAALGRVPSGLFVLTAKNGPAETGMLASWVQQCSFEPPQITVAIKRGRPITEWLTDECRFTVNILDQSQTDMVAHFGRGFSVDEPAFDEVEIERPVDGPPILSEAVAYIECKVAARWSVADHELVLGLVVGGRVLSEGLPMVHVRKSGAHY
jgi:flavin reductase (DIM6/NTAB) family NADH-FMN oxidoreductase RutF